MTSPERKIFAHWITRLLTVGLAAVFLTYGAGNLFYSDTWGKAFLDPGHPVWFRYLVGFVELSAGMLLLASWTVNCGVLIVITLMVTEMASYLLEGKPHEIGREAAPLLLVLLVLVARNERLWRWRTSRSHPRNA